MKNLIVSIFVTLSLIILPIAGESGTYRAPKKVYKKRVYKAPKHKNVYKGKPNPSWKYKKHPVYKAPPRPVRPPVYRTPPRKVYRAPQPVYRPAHRHRGCFIDSSMWGND